MRIFSAFIVRELRAQRVRTITTIAGIALGIAVVVAIQLAAASARRGFSDAVDTMAGRATLEIGEPPIGVDERRIPGLAWLQDVGAVTPVIEGEATFRPSDGGGDVLLRVFGVDVLTDVAMRDYVFSEARERTRRSTRELLMLLTDARAVVLTETFARKHGLRVGGTVRLTLADTTAVYVVRGLLAGEGPARAFDGNLVVMDIAAAQVALGRVGYVDRLEVRLPDGADLDRVEADLARALGPDLSVQRPSRRGRQVEQMLAAFHANLTALSAIALAVGAFLVYNTVSTSVLARRQEIGMLRAVGASRWQVFGCFIGEALMLAVPGCVIGLGLGRVLADGAVSLTSLTVARIASTPSAAPPALTMWHVWLALGVGVPLAILAALAPALEASRVPPIVAVRQAASIPPGRVGVRLGIGAACLALAGWLSTLGPVGNLPVGGYLAALSLLMATAAFAAPVMHVAASLAAALARRWGRIEVRLATATLVEYAQRLSVSVAALAVSLAMTVAIATMVGSFRETVTYWIGQTLVGDLFVGPASRRSGALEATVPLDVEAIVREHPGVAAVDTFRSMPIPFRDTQIVVGGGELRVLVDHGALLFKSPAAALEAVRAAIDQRAVVVSEPLAVRYDKQVGDEIELRTIRGPQSFRIAAIYYDYSNDRGTVVLDAPMFARYFGERRPGGLTVYLKPGVSADAVRAELQRAVPADRRMIIHTNGGLRREVLRIFDRTFAITWALELVAIAVAGLGIVATLVTLVVERRRELSLLRLIGAGRAQVQRMVVIEAALLGGISQALALVVGLALSLILIYVINVQSFGWSIQFHVPVLLLVQLSAVLVAATAVAGVYPARRAADAFLTGPGDDE